MKFNGDRLARLFIPYAAGIGASGICGNCNDLNDDYRTKNGTDVSHLNRREGNNLIGNSWSIAGANADETE